MGTDSSSAESFPWLCSSFYFALVEEISWVKFKLLRQIHFLILFRRQGKVRLTKWYSPYSQKERTKGSENPQFKIFHSSFKFQHQDCMQSYIINPTRRSYNGHQLQIAYYGDKVSSQVNLKDKFGSQLKALAEHL